MIPELLEKHWDAYSDWMMKNGQNYNVAICNGHTLLDACERMIGFEDFLAQQGEEPDAITAKNIRLIIDRAGFTLNDYARAYVHALPLAEEEYGKEGVKTQILYILNNVKATTPEQKAAKKQLMKLAKRRK